MSGYQGEAKAELNRCDRCSDRSVYPKRTTRICANDNGPEFVAQAVRNWIAAVGARTAYIETGSP